MNDYYVYGLFYKDKTDETVCFYIGSGTKDRVNQHFYESVIEETNNLHKKRKIRKLKRKEKSPQGKILVDNLTENQARNLEEKLLHRDDVFENTTNQTRKAFGFPAGKENPNHGRSLTEEHKKKISESLKGTVFTKERKQNISEAKSGIDNTTKEQKEILSKVHSGKEIEDWHKKRISEANKGEKAPAAKLTEEKAGEVKWLLENSSKSQREIASEYGISQSSVSSISVGDTWTHVKLKEP